MRWRLESIALFLIIVNCTPVPAQQPHTTPGNYQTHGEDLGEVLAALSDSFNLIIAYPATLIHNQSCKPAIFTYRHEEELLEKILQPYALELRKNSESVYLIRAGTEKKTGSMRKISGYVRDAITGEPLPLASIYSQDFSVGDFSNEDGYFELKWPQKNHDSICVSYLSYAPVTLPLPPKGKSLDVRMSPTTLPVSEVVVHYVMPPLFPGGTDDGLKMDRSGMSLANDLVRRLQMLPGVSAHTDNSARLKIRGSNTEQSMIVLDGIPLYNIDHYYGVFSAANPSYISEVTLYRNAQPIYLPSVGGGIVSMESAAETERTSGELAIDLLQSTLYLELPVGKKAAIKVAGRTTYSNVEDGGFLGSSQGTDNFQFRDGRNFLTDDPDFRFYDLNTGMNLAVSSRSELDINFFSGNDKFSNGFDLLFTTPANNRRIESSFLNVEEWSNRGASTRWTQQIAQSIEWKQELFYSNFRKESLVESEVQQTTNGLTQTRSYDNLNAGNISDIGSRSYFRSQYEKHNFLAGLNYNRLESSNIFEVEDVQITNMQLSGNLFTSYASYLYKNHQVFLDIGLRGYNYMRPEHQAFYTAPRLNAHYFISDATNLKLSAARGYQFLREIEFETRQSRSLRFYTLANNLNMPALRTDKLMLGLTHQVSSWTFDCELFARDMDGVLQLTTVRPGLPDPQEPEPGNEYRLYKGKRKVFGMDMLASYRKKGYAAWIAYTLSKSSDSFDEIFRGDYFASEDDRRHQLKVLQSLDLKGFTISGNVVYSSGRPYLSLDMLNNANDRAELDPQDFIRNLPAYIRLDLGVEYGFQWGPAYVTTAVSIFNLANRENVDYLQYAYRIRDVGPAGGGISSILGAESDLLDRTINLSFGIRF